MTPPSKSSTINHYSSSAASSLAGSGARMIQLPPLPAGTSAVTTALRAPSKADPRITQAKLQSVLAQALEILDEFDDDFDF